MGRAEQPEHANSVKSETLTTDLALYVHWPFCLAKCPYCDFNSHVRERIDQTRFALALRRELASEAVKLGRRRLTSVFFGGGTPSLMDPSTVGSLLDDAVSWFDAADDLEITSIVLDRLPADVAAFVSSAKSDDSVEIIDLMLLGDELLHWTPAGYDRRRPRPTAPTTLEPITPPSLATSQ